MTSLLTSISGQFSKSILLGTLFPVLLFLVTLHAWVLPLGAVSASDLFAALFPWEKDNMLLGLGVSAALLTSLLSHMNIPLIRIYEGYPWKETAIGQYFVRRQQEKLRRLARWEKRLAGLAVEARYASAQFEMPAEVSTARTAALRQSLAFPDQERWVLPTRLGNAIRAFEVYSRLRYGIDSIPVWPRLFQVIPAAMQGAIDDSKTSFDFMLHCSALSYLLAALALTLGLGANHPLKLNGDLGWLLRMVVLLAAGRVFYAAAVQRAGAWGTQVKVAFDLYRSKLLEPMGYDAKFNTVAEETKFWSRLNQQLEFPNVATQAPLPYASGQTALRTMPDGIRLEADRKIDWHASGDLRVTIAVSNTDTRLRTATSVRVIDKIPDGYQVTPVSVEAGGVATRVKSLAPLDVEISLLNPGQSRTLTYRLQKQGDA